MLPVRVTTSAIVIAFLSGLILLGYDSNGVEPSTEGGKQSSTGFSTGILPNSGSPPMGGSALSFDGIDDYVAVPDDPSLDLTNGFTVAAWIYLAEYTEWASVVTKGGLPNGAGDANNYTIHQSGPAGGGNPGWATEFGHLRFTGSAPLPAPLPESNSIIPLNEWHFVAVTFDGTTLLFYLDGEPDGQHAISGPLGTNDEPLHIGVDFPFGDEYWHGRIDELRIWSAALTSAQIRAAMHGHSAPQASALAGYWRFDEGSGNVAHDRSRHQNHGELMGNPAWVSPRAPNEP
jgi:hypothetical protein